MQKNRRTKIIPKDVAPALECVPTKHRYTLLSWLLITKNRLINIVYKPKSNLIKHAERELELSGLLKKDSDYNGMIGKEVLRLMKTFANRGHSGMSASFTLSVFEKLSKYQTLTPITSNSKDWMKVDGVFWQCKRNPHLFSKDGGKTYYHLDNRKKLIKSEEGV